MSRMTNDVENVSNAVSQSIASLISSVLTLIGAFTMMMYYSWVMALIACITIPLTITISANLAKFMRKYFVKRQKLIGALNGEVEEMVTSYKTVVAYGKEQKAIDEFCETSHELKKASILARVWGSIMGPCMNFLGNLQYVLLAEVVDQLPTTESLQERVKALMEADVDISLIRCVDAKDVIANDSLDVAQNDVADDIIKKAKNYITQNLSLNISRLDVANAVHLEPSYFSKYFKKKVGMTFQDYLL